MIEQDERDFQSISFEVVPTEDGWDRDDPRWLAIENTLLASLDQAELLDRGANSATPGKKGAADAIIVALGSAGVVTALRDVFREWLRLQASRSITLRLRDRDREVEVKLTNADIDDLPELIDRLRHPSDG